MIGQRSFATAFLIGAVALNAPPRITVHLAGDSTMAEKLESTALFLQLAPGENANYPKGVLDNTHFSPFGARVMASLAVEGIREARLGLATHFKQTEAPLAIRVSLMP